MLMIELKFLLYSTLYLVLLDIDVCTQAVHVPLLISHNINTAQVLDNARVFIDMNFIRGLPRIKFHINKNNGII